MTVGSDDPDETKAFLEERPGAGPYRAARPVTSTPGEPGGGKADTPSSDHAGHRARLRARFAKAGPEALADYELLELLLTRSIPRRDTKPIAKALIARFGSFGGALGADPARLTDVPGMGQSSALDLKIVAAAARMLVRHGIDDRQVLNSWSAVIDYCTAAMAHESREQFRVLYLDKKNGLIADEVQQTGTVDHTPVYPREVLRRCIELHATAIILVHNHPSGDPTPSRADIAMTKAIIEVLAPLDIVVHDHVVIGRTGHASLKGLGLM